MKPNLRLKSGLVRVICLGLWRLLGGMTFWLVKCPATLGYLTNQNVKRHSSHQMSPSLGWLSCQGSTKFLCNFAKLSYFWGCFFFLIFGENKCKLWVSVQSTLLKLCQNKKGQMGCLSFESFFWILISCLLQKKKRLKNRAFGTSYFVMALKRWLKQENYRFLL